MKNKEKLLDGASFILNSIPPTEEGDIVINNLKDDILKNKEKLKWFGYFSSTSVYGNYDGGWVDENSRLLPKTARGILRKNQKLVILIFLISLVYLFIFLDFQEYMARIGQSLIKYKMVN